MGTESIPTYGAPIGVREPGPPIDRPVAREADPETRRRMIQEHLAKAREEARARQAANAAPQPSPAQDLSAYGAGRKLIQRKARIEDAVLGSQ